MSGLAEVHPITLLVVYPVCVANALSTYESKPKLTSVSALGFTAKMATGRMMVVAVAAGTAHMPGALFVSDKVSTGGVTPPVAAWMPHPVELEMVTFVEGCEGKNTACDGVMVIVLPAESLAPDVYLMTRGAAGFMPVVTEAVLAEVHVHSGAV